MINRPTCYGKPKHRALTGPDGPESEVNRFRIHGSAHNRDGNGAEDYYSDIYRRATHFRTTSLLANGERYLGQAYLSRPADVWLNTIRGLLRMLAFMKWRCA